MAHDARIDVSVWLRETALMVSIDVGHASVCVGVEDGREMSYIEMTEDDTAKAGSYLCLVMLVNGTCPSQVAAGAVFEAEL